jgi:predicted ABC-type ATPase
MAAGRMVLRELNRLAEASAEFAFESTLSGLHYAKRLEDWKARGLFDRNSLYSASFAPAGVE